MNIIQTIRDTFGFNLPTFFILGFTLWNIPQGYYRHRFRSIVYNDASWKVSFTPRFWKEIKGLFGTLYPGNAAYLSARRFYRIYLTVEIILFAGMLWALNT